MQYHIVNGKQIKITKQGKRTWAISYLDSILLLASGRKKEVWVNVSSFKSLDDAVDAVNAAKR